MIQMKLKVIWITGFLLLCKGALANELPLHLMDKLHQHPTVSKLNALAKSYEYQSNSSYGLPNPKFEFGINNLPIEDPEFDRYLPTNKSFTYSQAIPNGSKRESQSKKNVAQSELYYLKVKDQIAQLKYQSLIHLSNLSKIDQLNELINQQIEIFEEFENWLKGELEAGENVYARFAEIDAQRSELLLEQNKLDEEKNLINNELIYLFEEIPDYRPTQITTKDWDGSIVNVLPLLLFQQEINVAQSNVNMTKTAFDYDYNFAITYQQREKGINFDGDDWVSLKFGVNIPLWANDKQVPLQKAAKMQLESKKYEFDNQYRKIIKNLDKSYADLDILNQRKQLLEQQNNSLKQQYGSLESRYESGETGLEPLLRLRLSQLKIAMQTVTLDAQLIQISSLIERNFLGERS